MIFPSFFSFLLVGYILGLGDRHCQNILIDYKTADIVHIDLGDFEIVILILIAILFQTVFFLYFILFSQFSTH